MSILIICNQKDPQPWADALATRIPETAIEIYPDVADPNEVDFVVCWKPNVDVLDQFPRLQVIQSLGAGVEHIFDTQQIGNHQQVSRIVDPELSSDMWEFVLAISLNHLKRLSLYQNQQKQKQWKSHTYQTIKHTTLSILGLGKIGAYVAEQFAQLGFSVQGWANSPKNILGVDCFYGRKVLPEILKTTDILINLLPLTPQTKGILCYEHLQHLKHGAFLINVGRGDHLVETDLLRLLEEGTIGAAALDVLSEEPLPVSHPFWEHPAIFISPHIASVTNVDTAIEQIVENHRRFKIGVDLQHQVSKDRGY